MSRQFLVVGMDGTIGSALATLLRQHGSTVHVTSRRPHPGFDPGIIHLDLGRSPAFWSEVPKCDTAVICAGVSGLSACRKDPISTRTINVSHTLALAEKLALRGTFIVLLSTNMVFDGSTARTSIEETYSPMTEYGRQKVELEKRLAASGIVSAVVRLTKVIHPKMTLLFEWLDSLRMGRPIHPFSDIVCAPILLETAILGIAAIAERKISGCWQFSSPTDISYASIATELARAAKANPELIHLESARGLCDLEHVPIHATLDASRAMKELRLEFIDSADAVQKTLGRMLNESVARSA